MESRFAIPTGLGLSREIDRAMHAVAAIPSGAATAEEMRESLIVASHRWTDAASRMREMAEAIPRPRRRSR